MPSVSSDIHLWIGLALLGWCSALTIHKQLSVIRAISEVVELPSSSSNRVSQQTQDAIKVSTLSQLLYSPNLEVRDASIQITAERALQSPTIWRLLRQQLRSTADLKERNQALCILVHFGPGSCYDDRMRRDESRLIEYDEFFHPATFTAIITCLCNMLPAAQEAEILRQHHDSAEADALWFANKLVMHNSNSALKAGLVKKWLVNYPLNVRDPDRTKEEVVRKMILNYEFSDDYERLLCCLLYDLSENVQARQQMAEHGLGDPGCPHSSIKIRNAKNWGVRQQYQSPSDHDRQPGQSEQERGVGEIQDAATAVMDLSRTMRRNHDAAALEEAFVRAVLQEEEAQAVAELSEDHAPVMHDDERVSRRREETAEGRALRSRRREAMVFAEAGRPMRQEDIFESQRGASLDELFVDSSERWIDEVEGVIDVPVNEVAVRPERTWAEFLLRLRPDGSIRE